MSSAMGGSGVGRRPHRPTIVAPRPRIFLDDDATRGSGAGAVLQPGPPRETGPLWTGSHSGIPGRTQSV